MLCVRLNYCSVKEFHVLNDLCALKIKDSVATMPGGVYDGYYGIPDSVEVNMKKQGETKFYFKTVEPDEFHWLLHTNGLTENDLNFCK